MTTEPNEEQAFDQVEIDLDSGFAADEPSKADEVEINLDFGGEADVAAEPAEDIDLNLDFLTEDEQAEDEQADQEPDEALTTALEELRTELRTKPGDWYVVHTYSGMENRVKQNIDARVVTLNMEDYIFETLVPTEDAVEIRNGQKKNVTRTFMPGYVLVRMDLTDDSWAAVRHTASVTGFVGHANTPVPLDLDEVERMLTPMVQAKVVAAGLASSKRRKKVEVVDYEIGDSVTVVDGPFTGVHATLTEINPHNQRVKAMVEILGRETPVDLTFTQIQKAL